MIDSSHHRSISSLAERKERNAREVPDNDDLGTWVATWHAPTSAAMAIFSGFFAIVAFFAFQTCR